MLDDVSSSGQRMREAPQQDDGKDLGVAVCITGQLSRLELRSKIDNLLRPLSAKAFIVLEKGSRVFSRLLPGQSQDTGCLDEPSPLLVKQLLGDYLADSAFPEHVAFTPDITQFPAYHHGTTRATEALGERAKNLANFQAQQENVAACVDLIESYEQREKGRF